MTEDISRWLEELGLGKYADVFAKNEVDASVLPDLTADDLADMAIPVGSRRKILRAIAALAPAVDDAAQAHPKSDHSRSLPTEAERRHLTVMFCDLVGSTALSTKLDPEEMGEVVRSYQACCADVVKRWEGHVAKFMGDGVLAYFGYPRAHEDDAERAVRAALELTGAVGELAALGGKPLAARVGIATGLVMVGELIGEGTAQERIVVGETPNLAARHQAIAEPGTVVIADDTRRLLGGLFELEDLGELTLKGIAEPRRAWRVFGEHRAESRFEVTHTVGLTPFVGRVAEVDLLLHRWEQAKDGEGQVVLLSGEAGIGKSRVLQSLHERIAAESHSRLRYQCSPRHTNSAFYPVIRQLELAADFSANDIPARKLDKLEALLAQSTDSVDEAAPLFAALLSVPTAERYPPIDLSPQRQKDMIFQALVDQIIGLSRRQPVLFIFEDAHWIDPTTQELLALTIERIQDTAMLAVITFRSEFVAPWGGHTHITTLALNRLGRRDSTEIVARVTRNKELPAGVLNQILTKADGVPLFVEELTKMVLESGQLDETDDRYSLSDPVLEVTIPATLHDSLMERLDRLDLAKEVAQIAACIGREFSHDLLGAVAELACDQLQDALDRLVKSELVFRRGTPHEATYTFKHALIQDLAYDSLLRSKRRQLHERIARALEVKFPETAKTTPELLAHHYKEAGLAEKAIPYLHLAGQVTSARSANKEAITHYTAALEIISNLPESTARTQLEIQLLIALGPILAMTKGYAASEVQNTYDRARLLCREAGTPAQLFTAIWGSWLVYQTRLQLETAQALADELLNLTEQQTDSSLSLQAHHAAWATFECVADLTACLAHSEKGLALYDQHRHREHKFIYAGHDPGVCSLDTMAMIKWLLGYPDQALERVRNSVELARELAHAASAASALARSTLVHQFRGDITAARQSANSLISLCAEQSISPQHMSFGNVVCGWAEVVEGQVELGLAEIRNGLDEYKATRVRRRRDYLFGLLADACYRANRFSEGLEAINQALRGSRQWWEAELFRQRGELLLAKSANNHALAKDCFREALTIAQHQKAKSLELRTLTSMARLLRDQGKRKEAYDHLAPTYNWFTEGFDTADLKDAKALLDELS